MPGSSTDPPHEPNETSADPDALMLADLVKDAAPGAGEDVDAILNAQDFVDLIDVLQQLGVQPDTACRFVNSIRKIPKSTVMEL